MNYLALVHLCTQAPGNDSPLVFLMCVQGTYVDGDYESQMKALV